LKGTPRGVRPGFNGAALVYSKTSSVARPLGGRDQLPPRGLIAFPKRLKKKHRTAPNEQTERGKRVGTDVCLPDEGTLAGSS